MSDKPRAGVSKGSDMHGEVRSREQEMSVAFSFITLPEMK